MSSDRVYLEYLPDEAGRTYLQQLQAVIAAADPAAQLVPSKELHLTLIHFGIREIVFEEMRREIPSLERPVFESAVNDFVATSQIECPETLASRVDGLALFGNKHDIVVANIELTHELIEAHRRSLDSLQQLIAAMGITDVEAWMAASHNFQFALNLKPHVSLAKRSKTLPIHKGSQLINFKFVDPTVNLKEVL